MDKKSEENNKRVKFREQNKAQKITTQVVAGAMDEAISNLFGRNPSADVRTRERIRE